MPYTSANIINESNWPALLEKLQMIPNATIYRKNDIPDRWNYKNNPRVPDLLIMPTEGTIVVWCLSALSNTVAFHW